MGEQLYSRRDALMELPIGTTDSGETIYGRQLFIWVFEYLIKCCEITDKIDRKLHELENKEKE